MLRLERSKERKIRLSVGRREPFFSKTLLLALAIGFGIHFAGAVLFRVKPLKIVVEERTLVPVIVKTEAGNKILGTAIAETDIADDGLYDKLIPPLSYPHMPMGTQVSKSVPLMATPEKEAVNYFVKYENQLLEYTSDRETSTSYPPIHIHVSGPLSSSKWVASIKDEKPLSGQTKRDRARFAVKVDNTSGLVFWYETLEMPQNRAFCAESEKILRSLRFDVRKDTFATSGEVEIVFTRQS